jgi:hypothetical protein
MTGIRTLMDDIGGWQDLTDLPGTPLVHTGRANPAEHGAMLELLMRYFPQWRPDAEWSQ